MYLPQVAEIKISYHPTKADKPEIKSAGNDKYPKALRLALYALRLSTNVLGV